MTFFRIFQWTTADGKRPPLIGLKGKEGRKEGRKEKGQ